VRATDGTSSGFVRAKDGTIATVDPPGSIGTGVAGINAHSEITGTYNDSSGMAHGFLF